MAWTIRSGAEDRAVLGGRIVAEREQEEIAGRDVRRRTGIMCRPAASASVSRWSVSAQSREWADDACGSFPRIAR